MNKINQIANNSIRVKKINQELIKQALKSMKEGTKSTIASATGLSIATCGNILNELLETGEVIETELEASNGGRPARRFIYNADFSYIACIYAKIEDGQKSITYAVTNSVGDRVDHGWMELEYVDAAAIDHLLDMLIQQYNNIKAVGIGIPGLAHQGVINICDIKELINAPLESLLREKYELEVTIENDMNLTVYGFYKQQDYEEDKTIVVVTFIKGAFPGAGMMIDGHIHKGNTRFAGEVSFLPFGISREQQLSSLDHTDTFIPLAAHTISSLIAIINPETIALTGEQVKQENVRPIYQRCLEVIPEEHMPHLIVLDQPDDHYMNGLIAITLESLTYSLQLVEKRR
ncbi:putative NBD/HSP70 family sugar kinase [Paenibacillus sp. PastF-4]|uniref:ROK family protein n=2 Tax=Paenibacillus TaxID=44249 RepID=UPI002475E360|nr:ROK family protein [Paenibacillus sp. PastF-4]MDH6442228.1 putative NBD/HSP70 family sugar kinase [Paenibacillus sp. PastF-4]